jgi:hypothetical protein
MMSSIARAFRLWLKLLFLVLVLSAFDCGVAVASPALDQPRRNRAPVGQAGGRPGCKVQQQDGNWWLLDPQGQPFFSVGINCVVPGLLPEALDPENPAYSAWQYYADTQRWAEATLTRLQAWGFTTLGGWSEVKATRPSPAHAFWLTPVLHIGSTAGAPWWDMWEARNLQRMDEVARPQILAFRDDPHRLGYYSDNEVGWWNASLWRMTLDQSSSSGQRQRLLRLLRDRYQKDWQKLLVDFEPENARNWSELKRHGNLVLKPGGEGVRVMRQFLSLVADRYYQLMRDIIRKYDPQALYLGDRYQSFFYPEVARAAAPYVDAISSNHNASWSDGSFVRHYLDTLHALTGRPVLVSEFYVAARENRSGNRNSHGVFPCVTTQPERAEAARRTLQALLRLPYVIGADWFQFCDEPTHGREDGENFNFGLVDIHDEPYQEMVAVFAALNANHQKARPMTTRTDASHGVPRAPIDPFANFLPTRAMRHWDREGGYVLPVSPFPVADLYLCWSPRALYLGLHALDIVESAYYRGGWVPKDDRARWTVTINGTQSVRTRLGTGREPLVNHPQARVENLSGLNLDVRNIAIMELPVSLLGVTELKAGDTVDLSSTLLTHLQAYQVDWAGKFTLKE